MHCPRGRRILGKRTHLPALGQNCLPSSSRRPNHGMSTPEISRRKGTVAFPQLFSSPCRRTSCWHRITFWPRYYKVTIHKGTSLCQLTLQLLRDTAGSHHLLLQAHQLPEATSVQLMRPWRQWRWKEGSEMGTTYFEGWGLDKETKNCLVISRAAVVWWSVVGSAPENLRLGFDQSWVRRQRSIPQKHSLRPFSAEREAPIDLRCEFKKINGVWLCTSNQRTCRWL